MRTTGSGHDDEVTRRRLATLRAEVEAVRREQTAAPPRERSVPWEVPESHTRLRPASDADTDADPAGQAPVEVPLPGRHARARWGGALLDSLPASLRGRVALGPGQVLIVALLVIGGLAFTGWWLVRGEADVRPAPVAAPVAASPLIGSPTPAVEPSALTVSSAEPATGARSPAASATDGEVVVDVAGKVRRPGLAVLPAGSRVADALDRAGGARRGVDLTALNLARVLVDGEQILVGISPPPGVAAAAVGSPGATPAAGALVSLNAADQTALESLPEVGPVTAEAILAWRTDNGGFTSVDELLEVDGIGEATLAKIAPHVTL